MIAEAPSGYASELFPLVEYVLAAEFDIDKGSSLSFQYPCETGTDPATLAEWMLPEGAHLREQDTTYFILNRCQLNNVPKEVFPFQTEEFNAQRIKIVAMLFTLDEGEWRSFQDSEWLLTLIDTITIVAASGLGAGAQTLSWNILGATCEYLSSLVIWFPDATPNFAIRFKSGDDRVFFTHYLHEYSQVSVRPTTETLEVPQAPYERNALLHVMNVVSMKHISGARRSARVKSLAVASSHSWVHVFKPLIILALDAFFATPQISVLEDLFNQINAIDVSSIPVLTWFEKKTLRSIFRNSLNFTDSGFKSVAKSLKYADPEDPPLDLSELPIACDIPVASSFFSLSIKAPIVQFSSEFGEFSMISLITLLMNGPTQLLTPPPVKWKNEAPFSWHPHLDTGPSTHPLIILISALLTEKRVLFIGHGKPSNEVCKCVLACTAIAAAGDWIPSVIHRAFPYTSLASLDQMLGMPGYIAGVTNPVFEDQNAWWDVAVNLNTGKLLISPKCLSHDGIESKDSKDKEDAFYDEDDSFLQDVQNALGRHLDEHYIRQLVYSYVKKIIFSAHTKKRGEPVRLLGWRNRVDGILTTKSFSRYISRRNYDYRKTLFPQLNARNLIHELNNSVNMTSEHAVSCFLLLDHLVNEGTDDQLVEILSYIPVYDGSGLPFSVGLFHERPEVRSAAARIIQRLLIQKVGDDLVNPFVKLAVIRLLKADATNNDYHGPPPAENPPTDHSDSRPSTAPQSAPVTDDEEDDTDSDSSEDSLHKLGTIMGSQASFDILRDEPLMSANKEKEVPLTIQTGWQEPDDYDTVEQLPTDIFLDDDVEVDGRRLSVGYTARLNDVDSTTPFQQQRLIRHLSPVASSPRPMEKDEEFPL